MPLLEMKHICKSFSGVYANENISLTVEKGEIHALLEKMVREKQHWSIYFLDFILQTKVRFTGKNNRYIFFTERGYCHRNRDGTAAFFPCS